MIDNVLEDIKDSKLAEEGKEFISGERVIVLER